MKPNQRPRNRVDTHVHTHYLGIPMQAVPISVYPVEQAVQLVAAVPVHVVQPLKHAANGSLQRKVKLSRRIALPVHAWVSDVPEPAQAVPDL